MLWRWGINRLQSQQVLLLGRICKKQQSNSSYDYLHLNVENEKWNLETEVQISSSQTIELHRESPNEDRVYKLQIIIWNSLFSMLTEISPLQQTFTQLPQVF